MFETLMGLLSSPNINESNRPPIVDNLFGFLDDTDHVKLALEWLENGKIFLKGQ